MSNEISLGNLNPKDVEKDDSLIAKMAVQRAGMLGLNLSFYTVHYKAESGQVTATLNEEAPDIKIEVS
jgi:hypothetical protein